MAQAEGRNWSPLNKSIHKSIFVAIGQVLDFCKWISAPYNMADVTAAEVHGIDSFFKRCTFQNQSTNSPAFSVISTFITALTTAPSLYSVPDQFHFTPSYPKLIYILILSSQLGLCVLSDRFPSDFPTETFYAFRFSHSCYMLRPSIAPLYQHPHRLFD